MARDKRRPYDDEDNDRPRRRQRKDDDEDRGASASGSKSVLIGIIAGGLLVIALGIGGYFLFKKNKKPDPVNEVVQNDKSDPLPKGDPLPKTKQNSPTDSKTRIDPLPKLPVVDKNVLQPFAEQVRLDVMRMHVERVLVSDPENVVGILWSKYEGNRKSFFDRYEVKSGKRLERLEIPDRTLIQHATLSPDGNMLLTYGVVGGNKVGYTCTLWLLPDKKALLDDWQPFSPNDFAKSLNFGEFVSSERFVTVTQTRKVDFWSIPDGKLQQSLEIKGTAFNLAGQDPYSHQHKDVALSPNRKTLAVWNGDGVTFIDTTAGTEIGKTPGIADLTSKSLEVKGTSFHPNGQDVVVWISSRKNVDTVEPDQFLITWKVSDRSRKSLVSFNANGYVAQFMTWWGPDYLLLYRGIPGQAIILHPVTGQPLGELMGPFLSRFSYQRNGSLWYAGGDADLVTAYANRIAFPTRILSDPNPWKNGYMKRIWMNEKGVAIGPVVNEARVNIGLITQPKR